MTASTTGSESSVGATHSTRKEAPMPPLVSSWGTTNSADDRFGTVGITNAEGSREVDGASFLHHVNVGIDRDIQGLAAGDGDRIIQGDRFQSGGGRRR